MAVYLSKSDFRVARECPAKLDILEKAAGVLGVVEVKSASVDTSKGDPLHGTRGEIRSDRRCNGNTATVTVRCYKRYPSRMPALRRARGTLLAGRISRMDDAGVTRTMS